jgi:hypothetical protein
MNEERTWKCLRQVEHIRGHCDTDRDSCYSIFSFICMFCWSLFVLLYFFFWPLCCLFFFDIRILITPPSVITNLCRFWLSYLNSLLPKLFKFIRFPIYWFERTWWRLFQKRVLSTKLDIYDCLPISEKNLNDQC